MHYLRQAVLTWIGVVSLLAGLVLGGVVELPVVPTSDSSNAEAGAPAPEQPTVPDGGAEPQPRSSPCASFDQCSWDDVKDLCAREDIGCWENLCNATPGCQWQKEWQDGYGGKDWGDWSDQCAREDLACWENLCASTPGCEWRVEPGDGQNGGGGSDPCAREDLACWENLCSSTPGCEWRVEPAPTASPPPAAPAPEPSDAPCASTDEACWRALCASTPGCEWTG